MVVCLILRICEERNLTLRCTRLATAGFARFRERVNSNVRSHDSPMPPFALVKIALWLAFAGCTTLCFVTVFSATSLVVLSVVTAALVYWLLRHRNELRNTYVAAESAAAVPGRYDKQICESPRVPWRPVGLSQAGMVTCSVRCL